LEFVLEAKKLILLTGINSNLKGREPAPYSLGELLLDRGLLSLTLDPSIERVVCIDYSPKALGKIKRLGLGSEYCTLVRMEPSVVLPANFTRSRKKQFSQIITVGGPRSKQDSASVNWPLIWPSSSQLDKLFANERAERIVLINGNKMSLIKGELYSLRREAIAALDILDLYGTDWDSSLMSRLTTATKSFAHTILSLKFPKFSGFRLWFQSYPKSRGVIADKSETMSRNKYALVIENSTEYMSEKLFDAFFAGCIPIYVGPNVAEYNVPENLVLQAEPNLKSIKKSIDTAKEMNFENFQQELRKFLSDEKTIEQWSHENVYKKMLEIILGR
jgi:alpha(1,3/1,4) fucosyltransferase